MGIIIYTKNKVDRRKRGKDLFKVKRRLEKTVKYLILTNLISIGFICYQNKEIILEYIKELYGKMA